MGEGYCDKIFYLTPKTATRKEAFSAMAKLYSGGSRLRTVIISAKEQVCLCGTRRFSHSGNPCNGAECELAAGYYDRAEAAVFELLSKQSGFTLQSIMDTALKYRVCPYELSHDLSEYCDIIICDYNYVFDPSV